jgi:Carboxypeptidase regulatory-like domain
MRLSLPAGRAIRVASAPLLPVIAAVVVLCVPPATAQGQGLTGVVADQVGPVAGAAVAAIPRDGSGVARATTAADGSYTLEIPAGSYSVGVTPPPGSLDGYFEQDGVVVVDGASATLNAALPASEATGQLSGVARYSPSLSYADVQVKVTTVRADGSLAYLTDAQTAADGSWTVGQVPAATYLVQFVVDGQVDVTQYLALGAATHTSLSTTLVGARPTGTVNGTVTESGVPVSVYVLITLADGMGLTYSAVTDAAGNFTVRLPVGIYTVVIPAAAAGADTASFSATLTVADGAVTVVRYQLYPLAVPPGTSALHVARDLGYLNAERTRWGLPARILENPVWSQACAAHDAYLHDNSVLEHPETEGRPGYSPGGDWGGAHSVLAEGSGWVAQANPWEDAPIHLNQLMAPGLAEVGIDESSGYACVTTWPGIRNPPPGFGDVITYPGNGTSGLPPAERASESPFVPGQFVGIPRGTVAGRELFVYSAEGASVEILSASLHSASGPAAVKWVDSTSPQVGPDLAGAVIIPEHPLLANTTYSASVTLAGNSLLGIPQVSHQWSFSTGAANPSGYWPRASSGSAKKPLAGARLRTLARLTVSPASFKAATRGAAADRRHTGATVTYGDSAAAATEFEVLRRLTGRMRGRSCVSTARARTHTRLCVRLIRVYTFTRRDRAGVNRFHVSGRTARRALAPGRYLLRAIALPHQKASSTVSAAFRILS